MEDIKTFEDICKELQISINPIKYLKIKKFLNKIGFKFTIDYSPYKKIEIISQYLNKGLKPDWSNTNEKWYSNSNLYKPI